MVVVKDDELIGMALLERFHIGRDIEADGLLVDALADDAV